MRWHFICCGFNASKCRRHWAIPCWTIVMKNDSCHFLHEQQKHEATFVRAQNPFFTSLIFSLPTFQSRLWPSSEFAASIRDISTFLRNTHFSMLNFRRISNHASERIVIIPSSIWYGMAPTWDRKMKPVLTLEMDEMKDRWLRGVFWSLGPPTWYPHDLPRTNSLHSSPDKIHRLWLKSSRVNAEYKFESELPLTGSGNICDRPKVNRSVEAPFEMVIWLSGSLWPYHFCYALLCYYSKFAQLNRGFLRYCRIVQRPFVFMHPSRLRHVCTRRL